MYMCIMLQVNIFVNFSEIFTFSDEEKQSFTAHFKMLIHYHANKKQLLLGCIWPITIC